MLLGNVFYENRVFGRFPESQRKSKCRVHLFYQLRWVYFTFGRTNRVVSLLLSRIDKNFLLASTIQASEAFSVRHN